MAEIHVLDSDGRQVAYDETQVADLLARGALTHETYYWRPGMADWRQLGELFAETQPLPPPPPVVAIPARRDGLANPPPSESPRLGPVVFTEEQLSQPPVSHPYFLRNELDGLARIVQAILGIGIVVGLAAMVCLGWASFQLHEPFTKADSDQYDSLIHLSGGLSALAFLGTEISFLVWVYRANQNCRGFVADFRFSSWWAAACFFVPIVFLYQPWQVMQDIAKASRHPKNWRFLPSSGLVNLWWGVWLVRWAVRIVAVCFYHRVGSLDDLGRATSCQLLVLGLGLLFYFITLLLVRHVTQMQRRLVRVGQT